MKVKTIKTALFTTALLLGTSLSANECINIKDVDVKWTSFKTLSKIGVSGGFSKIDLDSKKNASSIKDALLNTKVKINIFNIDAKAKIKTDNILKYFVSNLKTQNIDAKIVEAYDNALSLQVYLNGKKQNIPMSYKLVNNKIEAKGVLDALDFDLSPALKVLNTNVAGHLNKGWYDIPISFTLDYNKKCI